MKPNKDFIKVLEQAEDFPSLPAVTQTVMQMTLDPDISLKDIAGMIEKDVSLAARILKVVNSAYYGLSREISNIQNAVSLLGIASIRNIAVTLALFNVFPGKNSEIYENLFQKSFCAAITSNLIANVAKLEGKEDIFLAGLMQNIGVFVFLYYLPEKYTSVINEAEDRGIDLLTVERERLGLTSTQAGEILCERWHLPEAIKFVIKFHRNSQEAQQDKDLVSKYINTVRATYGGSIAAEIFFGSNKARYIARFKTLISRMNLGDKEISQDILASVPHLLQEAGAEYLLHVDPELSFDGIIHKAELELEELYQKHEHTYREFISLSIKANNTT